MSQRLMSRSQKSWPGNVPGAKSPNANRPKRQMSAGKCLSADGEPPFVSLPAAPPPESETHNLLVATDEEISGVFEVQQIVDCLAEGLK